MENDNQNLIDAVISIASETYRFQNVFEKAISGLEPNDKTKYMSQFSWFSKKVNRAINEAGLTVINPEGQKYDPGIAATPLNIEDFEAEDELYIQHTIEPIIMKDGNVVKIGTVMLGRIEK